MIVIGILPLFTLGFISYQTSSHTLQQAEKNFSQALLKDQKDLLQLQLVEVENLIANISGVEEITQALDDKEREANTYTNLATQARIGYILNGYLHLQGLVSIDIFTEGGAHYHVGDTLNVSEIREDVKEQIKTEALKHDRQIYWAGVVPNVNKRSNHQQVLAAARILRKTDRQTLKQIPIALILVNYSLEYLYEHFSDTDLGVDAAISLSDQQGRIIYARDKHSLGQPVSGILEKILDAERIPETITWNREKHFIQTQQLDNFNWNLISIIPEKSLLSGANTIRQITLLLLFIGLVIVGIAAWLFSKNVVKPVRSIISGYKRLQDNPKDLDQHLPVHSSDEMGELVKWFNSFLDNLSAQQSIEAARRESEERYALVVNATHEGIWDWNLLTDEIYFSPRFIALLGLDCTTDSITNKPKEWFDRIHPDDFMTVKEAINSHLTGNSAYFQCEHRLQHQDGTFHWVLSHGLAVCDDTGQAIRMAGSHTDISDRKEAESQLVHHAFHDELTGLNNRAWFVSYLQKKLTNTQRDTETTFAVLFLDLDKFKIVNDTLGHSYGDALLIQVADRLKRCLRETDMLARLGGDEFVILLEQNDNYHSIQVAERILISLAAPFSVEDQEIQSG
ncbi:MAG: diguanylate cyclase, partial [Sedimenticola sp.]|nr:diguanylate cyclase [Sedimenticola sp.]